MSSTNRGADRIDQDQYPTPQWCIDAAVPLLRSFLDRMAATTFIDAVPWSFSTKPPLTIVDAGAGDGRIGLTVAKAMAPLSSRVYLVESDSRVQQDPREFGKTVADLPAFVIASQVNMDYSEFLAQLHPEESLSPVLLVANPPFSASESFVARTVAWMDRWYGENCLPAEPCRTLCAAVFLLRLNWLASARRYSWLTTHPPARITAIAPRPSFCRRTRIDPETGREKVSSNDSCEYGWVWWLPTGDPLGATPTRRWVPTMTHLGLPSFDIVRRAGFTWSPRGRDQTEMG